MKIDMEAASPSRSLRKRGWLEETIIEDEETGQHWRWPALPEFSFRPSESSSRYPSSSHWKDPNGEGFPPGGGNPSLYLCSRREGSFRDVNQRKPLLCKGIVVWTSPEGSPQRTHRFTWQTLGHLPQRGLTAGLVHNSYRGLCSFCSDTCKSRSHTWVRSHLRRRGTTLNWVPSWSF